MAGPSDPSAFRRRMQEELDDDILERQERLAREGNSSPIQFSDDEGNVNARHAGQTPRQREKEPETPRRRESPVDSQMGDQTALMVTIANMMSRQLDAEKRQREHELQMLKEKDAMDEKMRQRELAYMTQMQSLLQSSGNLHHEKRTFVTLPLLTSEAELENWDSQLRAALAPYELYKYLDDDVPEPDEADKDALNTWKADRADIYKLITASLKKSTIWSRMTRIGWKPEIVDPRAAYRKVFEALQHGTANTTRMVIQELMELKPAKFDTMDNYINRLCVLRNRLRNTGIINPLEMDVYPVLTAIKDNYTELFERNIRKMEKKTLTWEDLIKDMTETCVDKDIIRKGLVNVNIEAGKKKKDEAGATTSTTAPSTATGDKKHKKCNDCERTFKGPVKHCHCGHHHRPGGKCWSCNPELAPDEWPRKAEMMAKKNEGTSTASLHQNSGLSNPQTSSARTVNLLHSTNFASLQPSFR